MTMCTWAAVWQAVSGASPAAEKQPPPQQQRGAAFAHKATICTSQNNARRRKDRHSHWRGGRGCVCACVHENRPTRNHDELMQRLAQHAQRRLRFRLERAAEHGKACAAEAAGAL